MFVKFISDNSRKLINFKYCSSVSMLHYYEDRYLIHFRDAYTDTNVLTVSNLLKPEADFLMETLEDAVARNDDFFDINAALETFNGSDHDE